MIYEFRCASCGNIQEIIRLYQEASEVAFCSSCGSEMQRIYSIPNISVPKLDYYDHGLGTYVSSKHDIKEAQRKYHDRTGSELVEVGTDKIEPKKPDNYKLSDKETREIYQKLEVAGVQGD